MAPRSRVQIREHIMIHDVIHTICEWPSSLHVCLIRTAVVLSLFLFTAAFFLHKRLIAAEISLLTSRSDALTTLLRSSDDRTGTLWLRIALRLVGVLSAALLSGTLLYLGLTLLPWILDSGCSSGWISLQTRTQLLPLFVAMGSLGGIRLGLFPFQDPE